jgi:hypothetical protein
MQLAVSILPPLLQNAAAGTLGTSLPSWLSCAMARCRCPPILCSDPVQRQQLRAEANYYAIVELAAALDAAEAAEAEAAAAAEAAAEARRRAEAEGHPPPREYLERERMKLVEKACKAMAEAEQQLAFADNAERDAQMFLDDAVGAREQWEARVHDAAAHGPHPLENARQFALREMAAAEEAVAAQRADLREAHGRTQQAAQALRNAQLARLPALGADLPAAEVQLRALYPPQLLPPPPPLD